MILSSWTKSHCKNLTHLGCVCAGVCFIYGENVKKETDSVNKEREASI